MKPALIIALTGMLLALIPASAAEPTDLTWPAWRGADSAGSAGSGAYADDWSNSQTILWKAELPSKGCSTPIVWNQHILLTSTIDEEDALIDFDWNGDVRWQTKVGPARQGKHRNGSGSNPSAVTDGEHIFVYFKSGNLAGLNFAGEVLWKTNLQDRFAKDTLYWDLGTSPVLTDDFVVVAVMHKGESYLAAFEKETGDLAWRQLRNYQTPVEGDHSYATPIVVDGTAGQTIVVWGAEHLTGHAAADGKLLWSCGGFNPEQKGNWVAVSSAVIAGDIAVVPYGRGSHLAGVKLNGTGDVTETHRLWTRTDTGSFVPTPAVHDGKLYVVRDQGEVECIDPQTGETAWTGRFPKNRNKYYASPTVADGKIYAPREDGVVLVAGIKNEFQLLAENDMGERVIASPVPVDGKMLIRGERHLFCIGK